MIAEVDRVRMRVTIKTPRALAVVGRVDRELRLQISLLPGWGSADVDEAVHDARRFLEEWRIE